MWNDASPDGTWSIGELAARARVTVKTVRFYSDRGLLPEAGRSTGGHRRYGPEALDRLRLIRSLRALDLPVPDVGRVLDRDDALDDALEDVIADRLKDLGTRMTAMRWREAALQLLQDCPPGERAGRLLLIGQMATPPDTTSLARFWRRVLPVRLPAAQKSWIIEAAVPQPPADPAPDQVLAFARLHALACDVGSGIGGDISVCRPEYLLLGEGCRPDMLYDGLREAFAIASPDLRAGRPPREGEALDSFVDAFARLRGLRDTPGFRRRLSDVLARTSDPRIGRYWELTAQLSGSPEPTFGASEDWLRAALDTQVATAKAG
ncbi:MerR family transcriptional regulator [Streptomyces sp. BE147]|uniref:helix-turn-helix domain-containing protein n=1 Tax=Streptomyces sp. BE147 TaxID=3002524 RepID=UPI002E763181|nr:MerR family transcriptional regulator [Streptomyces sp. BE147]MEE1739333.1 MerR family transcriptional regulator [Streptomyces sp. BE147]